MDKRNIVYGLLDPRNDLVYYVGKTTIGRKRPLQHLVKSHSKEVNDWVNELQDYWIPIKVIVLEEVEDLNDLPHKEEEWISKCNFLNPDLLNKQLTKGIDYDTYSEEDERQFNNLRECSHKIGTILKRRRLAVGITQEELSKNCKISRSTLSLLENNESVKLEIINKVILQLEGERIQKAVKLQERIRHYKFPKGY